MKQIYVIRFRRGRFGAGWNAYCLPGYSTLIFPGVAGATTLDDCLDRCLEIIRQAEKRYGKSAELLRPV